MSWLAEAKANRVFRLSLFVAAASILFDQLTKLWILHGIKLQDRVETLPDGTVLRRHIDLSPVFDLTYVENRGVSFGLFAGGISSRVILSLLAIGVSVFVIHWAGRLTRKVAAIGAGLIIGGALGNAIDRIFYGYVVDFLDFSGLWFPWQFNIADACINVGVACLAYDAFFVLPKQTASGHKGEPPVSVSMSGDEEEKAISQNLTETKHD